MLKPIMTGDPETQSAHLTDANIEAVKTLFPEAVTEGRIDFEVLRQLLGDQVDERDEKYGLNWNGKRQARRLALTPSTGTLRPCPEESVDWDTTKNLMIEGDNLEVLKLLQKSYSGEVKLIYIDPPYNTGKDFVYPDDYRDNIRNYLERTGQVDGEGCKNTSNTESSGRFHTDWLNMMYPRLKLAQNLLRDDGLIFISIDDNEVANLRNVCNEIFGEENFIEGFVWKKSYGGGAKEQFAVRQHEFCLLYAKNIDSIDELWLPPDPEAEKKYYDGKDEYLATRGPFRIKPLEATKSMDRRENLMFPIPAPDGTEIRPKRQWWWSKERVFRTLDKNGLVFTKTADGWSVSYKQYLIGEDGIQRGAKPFSVIDGIYTQRGTADLRELFDDEVVIQFPKPVALLDRFLNIAGDKDALVLDFFAGSGTTAQAVLELNHNDHGHRKFILVQLPESTGREDLPTIAEITKERVRRVIRKLGSSESDQLDLSESVKQDRGFRVFKLDASNIRAWDPNPDDIAGTLLDAAEHLQPGRSESDILFELLLKQGLELTVPIEQRTFAGKAVHSIGGGTLFACLTPHISTNEVEPLALGIVEWFRELKPEGAVTAFFRDSAFADDVAKTNLAAILEQNGIAQVRSL